ncbi:RNA deprotection pyrophosphohydrolase [Bacillus sp. 1P06AnD]|uniref:RNA deprotection pyrophosphohydrolase n=1 Tax=Bacillus sp. 1P06AnD TaxID=3132208 RepID=UPI0039A152D5
MIHTCMDLNGNAISLTTEYHRFSEEPQHAIVIIQSGKGWVMTKHKKRGLEFPGGKREKGETIEEAAKREAWEETGAVLNHLVYLAQYQVTGNAEMFTKDVYFAWTDTIIQKEDYLETSGAVLLDKLPHDFSGAEFSFIMKDEVIPICLNLIKDRHLGR